MKFCKKLGQEIGFVGVKYEFKFWNVKNTKKIQKLKISQNPEFMSGNILRGIPIAKIRRLQWEMGFRIANKYRKVKKFTKSKFQI